jgi:phycocyanobilin lyase subunit beta
LGYNNPEAAVSAVMGLVELGEVAVQPIIERLDDYNYGARAYSFRALAAIAAPQALEVLINAAETDFAPSVRRAATKGIGQLCWSQLPAEQRHNAQNRALQTLLTLTQHPDWDIRYAAVVGLQALASSGEATEVELAARILAQFDHIAQTDADLAVRARAEMAQQQLNALSNQLAAISN